VSPPSSEGIAVPDLPLWRFGRRALWPVPASSAGDDGDMPVLKFLARLACRRAQENEESKNVSKLLHINDFYII
jgi:hypothetical protein